MKNNEKVLRDGFKQGMALIEQYFVDNLAELCYKLLCLVKQNREFTGWSGNTQTSYLGGVYLYGKLVAIVNQDNWTKPAIRKKLRRGERGYLRRPYEGKARSVQGKVDTDGGFGLNTSYEFLRGYKDAPKKGVGFVITTGTEYSVYLEQVADLDVLTKTYEDAANVLKNGFKPMSD